MIAFMVTYYHSIGMVGAKVSETKTRYAHYTAVVGAVGRKPLAD